MCLRDFLRHNNPLSDGNGFGNREWYQFRQQLALFSHRLLNQGEDYATTSSATISPREVLRKYKTIAVVGASKSPEKEAHTVPSYMKEHGYRIIPVNPTADQILGEKVYKSLMDIPPDLAGQVEVVDVFRPSEELPQVAQQVVDMKTKYGRPFAFWAQLGLENEEAKKMLSKNNIPYVMNACLRVVHKSL